jgi:hypothetical protein
MKPPPPPVYVVSTVPFLICNPLAFSKFFSSSLWFERSVTPAWGLFGGKDGLPPNVNIKIPNEDEKNLLKANGLQIKKGTVLTTYTGGGGGFIILRQTEYCFPQSPSSRPAIRFNYIYRFLRNNSACHDIFIALLGGNTP